jgi:hypothetical protein
MKKNMGNTDRIIRAIAGVLILAAGIILHSWWGALGAVLLATSMISFCPLYTLIGANTCGRCENGE